MVKLQRSQSLRQQVLIYVTCKDPKPNLLIQLSVFQTSLHDKRLLDRFVFVARSHHLLTSTKLIIESNNKNETDNLNLSEVEFQIIGSNLRKLSNFVKWIAASELISTSSASPTPSDKPSAINANASTSNKERHFRAPALNLERPNEASGQEMSPQLDSITSNNNNNKASNIVRLSTARSKANLDSLVAAPSATSTVITNANSDTISYEMNIYLAALGATLLLSVLTSTLIVLLVCGRKRDERRLIGQREQRGQVEPQLQLQAQMSSPSPPSLPLPTQSPLEQQRDTIQLRPLLTTEDDYVVFVFDSEDL